ncbi:divalent metal cation transporter, partial [Acinetobacter baumannii]
SMILVAYLVVPFLVKVPWGEALRHTIVPEVHLRGSFVSLLVGIFGNTISPYLFFWQAAGEAEESRIDPESNPLRTHPEQAPSELQ